MGYVQLTVPFEGDRHEAQNSQLSAGYGSPMNRTQVQFFEHDDYIRLGQDMNEFLSAPRGSWFKVIDIDAKSFPNGKHLGTIVYVRPDR
jgi:hypothetical protein